MASDFRNAVRSDADEVPHLLLERLTTQDAKEAASRSEQELNRLGYELLKQRRVADAVEVFKLNVEMFPDAFNVYDSLGEAYLKAGDRDLAAKNYRKSLELNPHNANAIEILKRIQ